MISVFFSFLNKIQIQIQIHDFHTMKSYSFQSNNNSKPFYQRNDFDLESGPSINNNKKYKKPRNPFRKMLKSIHHFSKSHPYKALIFSLSVGFSILTLLALYQSQYTQITTDSYINFDSEKYPFPKMKNLVMVAGHSVYTSSSCEKVEKEDSWFLEPYQKYPGQAATFLSHIEEGVRIADTDEAALLLFSGGETRKEAGPRSEAQSYWSVAELQGWFGKQENVRWRALTEEHARDSFENLLFSVCRFRELTGAYPQNITVVSYDFKEERFADLHRSAIRFPEVRFHYVGTPASPTSKEAAVKGESMVRAQFQMDPYGCLGSLHRKKLGRDPFRRTIPYPNGCPDIQGLFRYCGTSPYSGPLPWV